MRGVDFSTFLRDSGLSTKSLDGKDGITVSSAKPIKAKQLDGKNAQGFLIEFDCEEQECIVEMTVWADKLTKLPLKIESNWKHNGSDRKFSVTMTDFDYGEIPKEQFELKVPDGAFPPRSRGSERVGERNSTSTDDGW